MRASVNFWDELFGERVELQVPTQSGMKTVKVTKKWLEAQEAAGKMRRSDKQHVVAYIIDVDPDDPYQSETWTVGDDVSVEDYEQFMDPETQAMYAVRYYDNGRVVQRVMTKRAYEFMKSQLVNQGY